MSMQWWQYPITQGYNPPQEYGVDLGTPYGTPITSLYAGKVVQADYAPWGGEVTIATSIPGIGAVNWYVQHLDSLASGIQVGSQVSPGQTLGLSGGQNTGGVHPESAQWSSGPHTEEGFGAPWHLGGLNFNPLDIQPGIGTASGSGTGGNTTSTTSNSNSSGTPCVNNTPLIGWVGTLFCNIGNVPGAAAQGVVTWLTSIAPYIGGGILIIIGLTALVKRPEQVNITLAKGGGK